MPAPRRKLFAPLIDRPGGWRAYAIAAAIVGSMAVLSAVLLRPLDPVNIVMLFPLAVLFAAVRLGRGPAVLAAFLSVGLFDFFFVAPHLTLVVSDLQYLVTFGVMLAVALITAELATGLREQRDAAEERERRSRALYEMGRELSGALTTEQIAEIAERFVHDGFGAHAELLLPGTGTAASSSGTPRQSAPADEARVLLPLQAPMLERGMMAVTHPGAAPALTHEQRQLLDTFATLIAIALERVHYLAVAQTAQLDMAAERLRNSLLGALSHDLRTPLTALAGLADTLQLSHPPLTAAQAELAQAIRDEALRTGAQVSNLLDMARLQSGPIQLRREWQLLEDVVGAALQARARQLTQHRLNLDLPADLPLVNVDAVLMERALCNLLENAAKYTPPGSTIGIAACAREMHVEIVVTDDGPGLPPGREHQLFEKFSRGQSESGIPGVGLGLAIVRAVVEAHGGTVRAENCPLGGARFVIELPRGAPPALPESSA
jgi:two-component system sensor histidine kinase KdpD